MEKKRYRMIGANAVQPDPPYGEWIPPGYGEFTATLDPAREARLIQFGCIEVVPEKAKKEKADQS